MPEEEEGTATATAQAAREAAEARRRKILDSMNDRMSIVEGTAGAKGKDVGGDEDAAPEDAAPSSSTTPSASSRMAAMRRRRFKNKNKKEEAAAGAAPAEEDAAAKNKAEAEASSVGKTEKAKDSDEEKEDTAPVSEAPKVVEESKVEETPAATTTKPTTTDSSTAEPKKKYQGVAKMRRRMIKEKQQQKELEKPDSTSSSTAAPAIDTKKVVAKIQKRPAVLPILMHVVTVLLLFLAGLDVGLQQQQIDYFDGALLTVHSELAPRRQLGGLALVQKWTMGSADDKAGKPSGKKKPVGVDDEWQATTTTLEHDEFADVGRDSCESETSNLDPLFQVDLDKLTEGPGLYLWLARGAIRLHRLNLAIFWYGPRGFFLGLADWLFSLTTSPPVLCVLAIILRQLVGKVVLGAKLPGKVEDETQHKDVMSMIKLFISNFLFKSFPTATHLYDVWTHVRADMYVLLCGVFVGMAYSHNAAAGSPFGGKGSISLGRFEEIVPPPVQEPELPPTTSTEGISDEL